MHPLHPAAFLHHFGYLAVFAGTFLEGETILVLAGFFASRGKLSLPLVLLTAAGGAYLGHAFWFWLGRSQGTRLVARFPHFEQKIQRSLELIERHGVGAIFITQYLYGLRVASAVVFGLSRMSRRTFLLYQALSCALWACVIGLLGYFFGRAVERFLGEAVAVEKYAIGFILLLGGGVFLYHRLRQRRAARKTRAAGLTPQP
ncbi:MAG TPA: DedA family protein [Thermoanaerobaculia bacterium]|jgi:membrane protein DedA with SNARE-associated domain